ncbi:MAG TPA: tungsten formylmethanofuran dehydrogenase [Xanthobacteraceae bacterium]
MARAWIDGRPAALAEAVGKAATLLAGSRAPLVAGLGTDVAGARAAIRLAERIGAAIDHMNSDALFADLAVMRETGIMLTTPNEARLRADTLLLVGPDLEEAWPELSWVEASPASLAGAARSVVWLCPGRALPTPPRDGFRIIGRDPVVLPVLLAALRARLAGRRAGRIAIPARAIDELATLLKAARFGVAIWSAGSLDSLAIEMLCGIVDDLNAQTRFAGFSVAPPDNATGVQQVSGWMTGFPLRTGFGRQYVEHDPWRFDAARLVASREADCVLWISAYRAALPPWGGARADGPPVIGLITGDAAPSDRPAVQIEVGHPGVDHDAVEHFPPVGTLVAVAAARRSEALSVADAIGRIAGALGEVSP